MVFSLILFLHFYFLLKFDHLTLDLAPYPNWAKFQDPNQNTGPNAPFLPWKSPITTVVRYGFKRNFSCF